MSKSYDEGYEDSLDRLEPFDEFDYSGNYSEYIEGFNDGYNSLPYDDEDDDLDYYNDELDLIDSYDSNYDEEPYWN